jgi:hypothetical protein
MLALSDSQLQTVMATAASIDPDRRDVYLQRVGAMLRVRHRFDDSDVNEISTLAARRRRWAFREALCNII